MFNYRRATIEDLEKIWNKDIQENLNDKRYLKWKDEFIEANKAENIITFVVLHNDEPIGQASIVLNKNNISAKCRDLLCDGKEKAYVSTLRIEKHFEGCGARINDWRFLYGKIYLSCGLCKRRSFLYRSFS